MNVNGIEVTWLGHSTFTVKTPEGKTILIDPWVQGNPSCPESHYDVRPDAIVVTHGHNDHIGDLIPIAKASGAPTACIYEIAMYLGRNGVSNALGMNKGGTAELEAAGVRVTMTDAHHSSAYFEEDGTVHYLGEPAGWVIHFSNGERWYFAGDTCLFGDMALIKTLWKPTVAVLPIGDHFTMCPKQAAMAAKFVGAKKIIPCHYGTFPALTGTPAALKAEVHDLEFEAEVIELKIGA
ncbi:MAG: metal-dependent hydrolase [Myxococcales bacterium]|nr:metal-dependent hydrolase [Myxococcales bacterium]